MIFFFTSKSLGGPAGVAAPLKAGAKGGKGLHSNGTGMPQQCTKPSRIDLPYTYIHIYYYYL